MKIKTFYPLEDPVKKIKMQGSDGEKILANHI